MDDTALFLMYSETVLQEAISTLKRIERNTGLKISYEKTNIYRIGSLKNSNAKTYTQKNLNWSDGDIEMLGIRIRNSDCQDNRQYNQIIDKMTNVAMNWKDRYLTLIGKCLIVNSLMSLLFMYYMVTMPTMSMGQYARVNNIICQFLWGGKRNKIPLEILHRSKNMGGLNLCDLRTQHIALHLSWLPKIIDNTNFEYVYQWLDEQLGDLILKCNLRHNHCKHVNKSNTF